MRGEYGINPNVYNGGAVVFNSAPFVNYFLQQQAKKQAKQDSLEQYFQKQMTSLTPTGMRSQDLPGWGEKAKKWQALGMGENKKYLLNPLLDNYKTLTKFNELHNELKLEGETSKTEAGDGGKLFDLQQSGKWNPTDDDHAIVAEKAKSIYDPTRQRVSMNDLSINTPPFDPTKFLTQLQTGRERAKVNDLQGATFDARKGLMSVPYSKQYRPDDIQSMAEMAPMVMQNDRSATTAFKRILESPDLPKYQEAYNKLYPGVVDTPEKVAKAYTIMGVAEATGHGNEVKDWNDPQLEFAQKKELIRLHSSLTAAREKAKEARTGIEQSSVLNKLMNDVIASSKENMHTITTTDKDGKVIRTETGGDIPAVGDFGKAAMTQGDRYAPDAIRYIKKDGKSYVRPIVYKRKTTAKDGVSTTEVLMDNNKPVVDDGASMKLIPLGTYRDNLGREMFTGKILYGELGQDFKETSSFDPTSGTADGTGGWKSRSIKR